MQAPWDVRGSCSAPSKHWGSHTRWGPTEDGFGERPLLDGRRPHRLAWAEGRRPLSVTTLQRAGQRYGDKGEDAALPLGKGARDRGGTGSVCARSTFQAVVLGPVTMFPPLISTVSHLPQRHSHSCRGAPSRTCSPKDADVWDQRDQQCKHISENDTCHCYPLSAPSPPGPGGVIHKTGRVFRTLGPETYQRWAKLPPKTVMRRHGIVAHCFLAQ